MAGDSNKNKGNDQKARGFFKNLFGRKGGMGSGMAEGAKQKMKGRKSRIDRAVEGASNSNSSANAKKKRDY